MADTKERIKDRIDTGAEKAKDFTDRAHSGIQHAQGSIQGAMEGAGHMTSNVMDKAKDVAGNAMDKAKDVAHSAADMAKQAKDKVQDWAHSAADGLGHAKDVVADYAGEAYDKSAEYVQFAGKEMTTFIRRYPIPAILIGLGVGFLLGKAMRSSA
jgi:ElaB/YqjD/DUF883 family membrane-anchored ribosome-binding protein